MSKYHSYIFNLNNIEPDQFDLVGKQALDWKKFSAAEVSVAEGFVVSSAAFDDFVTAADLVKPISKHLSSLDIDSEESIANVSDQISQLILSTNLPSILLQPLLQAYSSLSPLAARNVKVSLSHIIPKEFVYPVAWGMQVKGEPALLVAIKQAWCQIFSRANLKLRAKHGYSGGLSVSVIVQKFPNPEASGMAFTLNSNLDVEISAQLGIYDNKAGSDVYKVLAENMLISEKLVFPQQKMRIHTNNSQEIGGPNYTEVSVSKAWQTVQKVSDSVIEKLAAQTVRAAQVAGHGVELNWIWESGRLQIFDVAESQSLPVLTKSDLESKVKKQLNVIKIPSKKGKNLDLASLADEIQASTNEVKNHLEKDHKNAQLPSLDIESTDKSAYLSNAESAELADTNNSYKELINSAKAVNSSWDSSKQKLPFGLVLDVSELSSDVLSQVKKYDGFYFDATKMAIRGGIVPESIAETDVSLMQKLVNKYVLELKLLTQLADKKPIYYQFSDIGSFEASQINSDFAHKLDGLERLISYPQVLDIEWQALRIARRDFGLSNLKIILPKARKVTEIFQIKKMLSAVGFNRTSVTQVLVEVAIPALLTELKQLDNKDVDGFLINLPELTGQMLSKLPTEQDLKNAITSLAATFKNYSVPVNLLSPVSKDFIGKLIEAKLEIANIFGIRAASLDELNELAQMGNIKAIAPKTKKRGRPSKSLF